MHKIVTAKSQPEWLVSVVRVRKTVPGSQSAPIVLVFSMSWHAVRVMGLKPRVRQCFGRSRYCERHGLLMIPRPHACEPQMAKSSLSVAWACQERCINCASVFRITETAGPPA